MNKQATSTLQLEILISTMNRSSLHFLDAMFASVDISECQILIINQTTPDNLLESNEINIRVINSFESGLPKSRNLAISQAIGDICLFSDDDVIYSANFQSDIYGAFLKHKFSDIITFQMTDDAGNLYNNYPNINKHDKKTVETVNSVVICFRRSVVVEKKVKFNLNFGLGAIFPTANEYVFLRNALKSGLQIFFEPKILLSHPKFSSGRDVGNDKIVYARAALFYKYSGILAYVRLGKHLWMVHQVGILKFSELAPKYAVGLKGIKQYRHLMKSGLEEK